MQNSGAFDLSSITPASTHSGSGVYVTEVTEASFDSTMRKSISYPIVLEFYSAKAPESDGMGATLTQLADEAGGSWLHVRMNIDTAPQIAQALHISSVPFVVGVVGGQMVPLWQGSMSKDDAKKVIGQLLQMAAGNGIIGKAEPQQPMSPGSEEPQEDPRYSSAYDAMGEGDYLKATQEFAKLLDANPGDKEAKIGKAQAGLLLRVSSLDPVVVSEQIETASGIDAIMDAADIDVASGQVEQGLARLTSAIADSFGDDREKLRMRLLELFDTQDPSDPIVLRARRNLATALF